MPTALGFGSWTAWKDMGKDTMVLKIHNHGKEIPADELEEIFNPFFTTKVSGTGLGLTLVRKIVKEHNGSISVKSDRGGTLFTVWLPISQKVPET